MLASFHVRPTLLDRLREAQLEDVSLNQSGDLAFDGSHPEFSLGMDGNLCFRNSWWFLVFRFWKHDVSMKAFAPFLQGIRVVRSCIVLFENILVAKLAVGISCFCEKVSEFSAGESRETETFGLTLTITDAIGDLGSYYGGPRL